MKELGGDGRGGRLVAGGGKVEGWGVGGGAGGEGGWAKREVGRPGARGWGSAPPQAGDSMRCKCQFFSFLFFSLSQTVKIYSFLSSRSRQREYTLDVVFRHANEPEAGSGLGTGFGGGEVSKPPARGHRVLARLDVRPLSG